MRWKAARLYRQASHSPRLILRTGMDFDDGCSFEAAWWLLGRIQMTAKMWQTLQ